MRLRLVMGLNIWQLQTANDVGFEGVADVYRADMAARDPRDPLVSDTFVASDLFGQPPDRVRLVFAAQLDEAIAGYAAATFHRDAEAETRMAEIEICVREASRRSGVASALMESVVPALVAGGQNSIIGYSCLDLWSDASIAFCEKYGLTRRSEERCSRARVSEIDDGLMQEWIDAAADGAPGYRLEQWEGTCPDHLLDAWCAAAAGMEDAPLDGIDFEPVTRAAAAQIEADRVLVDQGFRLYRTLALSPDGEPAGLTILFLHRDHSAVGYQGDTTVLAAHRGHGIGRLLKAANYQQVIRAQPELSVIETYNAQSNPWMLDINIAMAFKPHHLYAAYQAPMQTVIEAMAK